MYYVHIYSCNYIYYRTHCDYLGNSWYCKMRFCCMLQCRIYMQDTQAWFCILYSAVVHLHNAGNIIRSLSMRSIYNELLWLF